MGCKPSCVVSLPLELPSGRKPLACIAGFPAYEFSLARKARILVRRLSKNAKTRTFICFATGRGFKKIKKNNPRDENFQKKVSQKQQKLLTNNSECVMIILGSARAREGRGCSRHGVI